MSRIIKAVFTGRFCTTRRVFQWDTDDVLQIVNLDLPANYTVDFSNSLTGISVPVLATSDTVQIPPDMFVPGSEIYAWVWISDSNGGYTKCQATIPIDARAQRTGTSPTPAEASAWDEAVDTLNGTIEAIPTAINTALAAAKASGEFDGPKGDKGDTGEQGPAGPAGQDGAPGRDGTDGQDGYSPKVTITSITGGHQVKITDEDHPSGQSFNVMDGQDAVVDATLSQAGEAADAKVTGDLISGLRSDVNTLLPVNLAANTTLTSGKYVNYSDGELVNSSVRSATDYIDISDCEKIVYSRIFTTQSSGYAGIAFYNSSKTYISGVRMSLSATAVHYELKEVDVPENAVYVRLTQQDSLGAVSVYDAADYASKVPARLDEAEEDIDENTADILLIKDYLDDIAKDGYFLLDQSKFAQGGWQSYSSTDSRAYRVRYTEALKFDRDIEILAAPGYGVEGYISGGGTLAGDLTIRHIPANTTFKVYVRAFTEDTSSTADVATYAKAIKFTTALSDIIKDRPTHTDVSMFCRIGISGDSYAAGGGIISGVTALTWGKNLERQSGVKVDIYAKSGENIVDWVTDNSKGLPAMLAGDECGLYWFQHGINGTSSAEALGTSADMSADPHPATFYGQYVEAIEQVKTAFPNARIVIATPVWSSYGLTQAASSQTAINAVKDIAEYCEVPCIEVTDDDFFRSDDYGGNTVSSHPTAMVAAGMAMAYRRLLSRCILDNPTYFRSTVTTGHGDGSFDYRNMTNKPSIPAAGIPAGGTSGQVLKKQSSTDYDVAWANESGGGGSIEPYTSNPAELGTASPGSSDKYARGDHVHAKPTYSKSDVGLGNVDNVQQYSSTNPPPYPVTSVNSQTGAVSLSIPSTAADVGAVAVAQGVAHAGDFVVVGSDGNITTVTMSTWQGGSY